MDPNELIQHGAEIVRAGAVAAGAAIPFTSIVKRMLGPAADEVAERIRDNVRLYRYTRQLKMLEKAEKMAAEAGFTPKAVPIKLLFPLLEGASFEENETLHDMWAALLANASNYRTADLVRPSFTELLKMMTPEEAKFLDIAFDHALESVYPKTRASGDGDWIARVSSSAPEEGAGGKSDEPDVFEEMKALTLVKLGAYRKLYGWFRKIDDRAVAGEAYERDPPAGWERKGVDVDDADRHRFAVVMAELQRMQMWSVTTGGSSGEHYYFTALGAQFVTVCRRPKPVAED